MDLFDRIQKQAGPLGKYAEVAEGYYMFPNGSIRQNSETSRPAR